MTQDSLFDDAAPAPSPPVAKASVRSKAGVGAAHTLEEHLRLRAALPAQLHLGTSSWNYPGWAGLVWDGDYAEAKLSKQGLPAYARHPLLRTVSLDRAFYRPLSPAQYAAYAAQVPDDFRFVVKAPSLVADALVRSEDGRGLKRNEYFLDPELAASAFLQPAIEGLGRKAGALVFQLSPLPEALLRESLNVIERLARMLQSLRSVRDSAPDTIVAVELRDTALLSPETRPALIHALRESGVAYCLGLHAKMPPISEQLPILRALWPGPLVCRWNLHRRHGVCGYEEAKRLYGAFDQIVDADLETRESLARVITGTTGAGYPAYVTIGNKAEGSAPLSVVALARGVAGLRDG